MDYRGGRIGWIVSALRKSKLGREPVPHTSPATNTGSQASLAGLSPPSTSCHFFRLEFWLLDMTGQNQIGANGKKEKSLSPPNSDKYTIYGGRGKGGGVEEALGHPRIHLGRGCSHQAS